MIDIHARHEPTFSSARGTYERWQHPVRMRDAMMRVERFRDEHGRHHLAEHGPSQHVDIARERRFYIDGMEKDLERQREESQRTGNVLQGFVYVPDFLLGDELMQELKRLHEAFPNITFVHGQPRPWHLDIPDDAEPELFDEIEEVTVLVPDKSRGVRLPRNASPDDWIGISVVNGYVGHILGRHEGRLVTDTVFTNTRHSPTTEDLFWSAPHPPCVVGLLRPWLLAHGWVERPEPRRHVESASREAELVSLDRLIPFSDVRMMGDDDNPIQSPDVEHIELVFDREHGVVLEVRELFEGEVAVREFFSKIAFDVPIDPALFAIPRPPDRTG